MFVRQSIGKQSASREEFRAYVAPLRDAIRENLRTGAHEQLMQFAEQMKVWRAEYPAENWDELRSEEHTSELQSPI